MPSLPIVSSLRLPVAAIGAIWVLASASSSAEVDFGQDILPLLSNNCFECHGPDKAKRKAGLRLDEHEGALAKLKSGERAVVPSDAAKSELLRRLTTDDPDDQMPPPDSGKKPLTKAQIATIEQWIKEGAEWSKHWSFEAPVKPSVPATDWPAHNAIDPFIHAKLKEKKLAPESEADKETLIRRVTLDLTGLPPTVAEIDAFLADKSPEAYSKLIHRLLASERYGEHMGRHWLDAARYADTHGLHLDNERGIWPYRDWVIAAFNRNQPYDEFTIEQLAGDLLPEPSLQQRVATGFNRCNVTTSEGGSIDDEYYVRYAVERVETTSTVWLGLTAGCAACHDHKFDPLSQKEFYEMFSYFYSLTEKAMDGNGLLPPPTVKIPTKAQVARKAELEKQLASAKSDYQAVLASLSYKDPKPDEKLGSLQTADKVWFDDTLPEGAKAQGNEGANSWKAGGEKEKHPVLSGASSFVRIATGLSQHYFDGAKQPLVIAEGDLFFGYVYLDPENAPETVQIQFNDSSWEHRAFWGADKGHGAGRNNHTNLRIGDLPEKGVWVRLEVSAAQVGLKPGAKIAGWAYTQFNGKAYWDKAGIVTRGQPTEEQLASQNLWEQFQAINKGAGLPKEIQDVLKLASDKRNDDQKNKLDSYYLEHVNPATVEQIAGPKKKEAEIKGQITELEKAIPSTLVMEDRKDPRQAHILERGQYTEKRDKVSSSVPEWIMPTSTDAPPNRLGLAQWLVDPKHPLTARVTVNRLWQQFFGSGLVKTSEDFGLQGEQPSHPQLLDWLAVDFVENGWDVKRLVKMLLESSTYRQSSRVDPAKYRIDPANRLLARGPRFRLDAEVIRDQALSLSGLMIGEIGGKSVKPYQPAGLWKPVGFGGSNTSVFKQDKGEKLYRRSMYTFWKRTSPPPSMETFDAPNRETCQVRRARTNTPLQALVLMNDVQFFESARKFAERVMREGGDAHNQRVTFAVRSALGREPSQSELKFLLQHYRENFEDLGKDPEAPVKLLSAGESKRDESLDARELAAWTMVTHLLLNLSETVTRG